MDKKPQIITYLEGVAPFIPFPIYWGDAVTLTVLGANQSCLEAMGAKVPEDVIGRTPYDYYPKDIADNIIEHVKKVVAEKKTLSQEDVIQDITTGKTRYYSAIRAPLFDSNNKEVVGIIGTSIEITAKIEAEKLKREVEAQQIETSKKLKQFSDDLYNLIQSYQYEFLNDELGKPKKNYSLEINIKLSKREKEILYYLALNQSPKEISSILSALENKNVTPATINALINKGLYIKFGVNTISQLIEKANSFKLIPFVLDNK